MKCHKCEATIPESEGRKHSGEILCEDCYIDSLYAAKPVCNPWEEYLSTRTASGAEESIIRLKNRRNFEVLLQTTHSLGATDAACILSSKIEISDDLATLCKKPKM